MSSQEVPQKVELLIEIDDLGNNESVRFIEPESLNVFFDDDYRRSHLDQKAPFWRGSALAFLTRADQVETYNPSALYKKTRDFGKAHSLREAYIELTYELVK
jgi:hypothetical protein